MMSETNTSNSKEENINDESLSIIHVNDDQPQVTKTLNQIIIFFIVQERIVKERSNNLSYLKYLLQLSP